MGLLATALNILLPHRCLLCSLPADHNLCDGCRADLPWLDFACRRCALPLPHAERPRPAELSQSAELCGRCLTEPPSFDRCHAAFHYATPVDRLIGQFKNRRQLGPGRLLTDLLLERLRSSGATPPDVIAPVPLHWRRQLRRGFNQAAFVAETLARKLDIPLTTVATRYQPTPKQQQLNRKQRLHNLRHAFAVKTGALRDRHVVIVDDVITTGATAEALARQLKRAGARRVTIWALARTPAPDFK